MKSLTILPGYNLGIPTATRINAFDAAGGIWVTAGKEDAPAQFGSVSSDTRVHGKKVLVSSEHTRLFGDTFEIQGTKCTWEDNGDNTFTLIGNMENQSLGDMDIKIVRSGQTITITTTRPDGSTVVDTIGLDENDYPVSGTFGGVDCTITMEGI